ncbi:viperin family antiviral radical SAM protein [Sulfitobacter faviae]|uniref:S-adenosylmethionine-dependent nucleotide dehydratase n=1 Tax=Sulfitobacter faviae TaxID=1775881 RepID=A0AAX3LQI5_9RHOB|nr:viperin family antiviral radical SAM protein [Sulfitobacter faviae]WCE70928.1 viperin family antiviral radical SAM protein [Sulfitobacter faviae]
MLRIPELTINWHILEACNYDCYFCYAKYGQKSIFSRDYAGILRELGALNDRRIDFLNGSAIAENVRINFAGGEPFLEKDLGQAIALAYDLGLRPSFISNGSLLTDDFITKFGPMISVAGFSVDSFDDEQNRRIGRRDNRGAQVGYERMAAIFRLFRQVSPDTLLKVNTVVCRENVNDDLTSPLHELQPDRWKALRVIPIHGATGRGITDDEFSSFLGRHQDMPGKIVPEDNIDMHRSYLMLDPDGCFYQREGSNYLRSSAILDVGAATALRSIEFDAKTYFSRY